MRKKIFKKNNVGTIFIFTVTLLCGIFLFGLDAKAAEKTVTDGNLTITYIDPLFVVTNAAPGNSFESEMTVANTSGKTRRFQFEMQMKTEPINLSDHLFLRIINANNEKCLFGCSKNVAIRSIDGKEIIINRIPGNSEKKYKFILTFDANAGNDFKNVTTGFDMKLGFRGRRPNNPPVGNGNQRNTPPTGVISGLFNSVVAPTEATGAVSGAEISAEGIAEEEQADLSPEEGMVKGEEISLCQSWPKWIWILMIIIYFGLFAWRTFEKLDKQIKKKKLRWTWQAGFFIAAFLIWYFFDKCREYNWFVILAVIGGAIIYLYYLYLFREGIKKNYKTIDSGESYPPEEGEK
ncbi:MAG: hypothetical protein WC858_01200 [Parcubacteria group bacterium]|jgi:hypothetical protein